MTTETGCRIAAEELKHDRDSEAISRRRELAYLEKRRQFRDELTQGEIAEAAQRLAEWSRGEQLIRVFKEGDRYALGAILEMAINFWIGAQAEKEVGRMIDRGEV